MQAGRQTPLTIEYSVIDPVIDCAQSSIRARDRHGGEGQPPNAQGSFFIDNHACIILQIPNLTSAGSQKCGGTPQFFVALADWPQN